MVNRKVTHLSDMRSSYLHHQCVGPVDDVVYYVEEYAPVKGESSALTTMSPGTIGGEFYMTLGHKHTKPNTPELYTFLHGHGLLYMISPSGEPDIRAVTAGDCIVVPDGYAHRVINTGYDELIFLARYDEDAGHDYAVRFPLHFGGVPHA